MKLLKLWNDDIKELESFFKTTTLPEGRILLLPGQTITDVPKFIENHLSVVKAQNGKQTYLSYLNRLKKLKGMLK